MKKGLFFIGICVISVIGCNNVTTNDKKSVNDIKVTTESVTHNNISADSLVYVVNDVKLPFEIYSALDRNKMESITVIKDSTAIQKYWEKGKKGVLYITLKETCMYHSLHICLLYSSIHVLYIS